MIEPSFFHSRAMCKKNRDNKALGLRHRCAFSAMPEGRRLDRQRLCLCKQFTFQKHSRTYWKENWQEGEKRFTWAVTTARRDYRGSWWKVNSSQTFKMCRQFGISGVHKHTQWQKNTPHGPVRQPSDWSHFLSLVKHPEAKLKVSTQRRASLEFHTCRKTRHSPCDSTPPPPLPWQERQHCPDWKLKTPRTVYPMVISAWNVTVQGSKLRLPWLNLSHNRKMTAEAAT